MEIFGLTKWNTAETSYENYSSMGSSLVMLAFMSTGLSHFKSQQWLGTDAFTSFSEGWNQYMHD